MKNNFDSNAFLHKTYRVCELNRQKTKIADIFGCLARERGLRGEFYRTFEEWLWRWSLTFLCKKKNVLQNFQLYLKHSSALDYKWKNQYARNWGFHLQNKKNWKILNSKVNIQVILAKCVSKMLRVCFTRREKRWK